jgi:hypothetical protein
VVKEREFASHASKEKGRFARTAKQAYGVHHDARERKVASVDSLSAEIIRHSGGIVNRLGFGPGVFRSWQIEQAVRRIASRRNGR